jgi:phospholipase C
MQHLTVYFAIVILTLSGIGLHVATETNPVVAASVPFASPIDHVVIIMMENHAYDNYFAGYCLHLSAVCNDTGNGIPYGTKEPQMNVTGGYVTPYNYTAQQLSIPDLGHTYNTTVHSIDGGKENGYYSAEGNTLEPFGHYNGSTLPVYWDLAQQFAVGDNFYSSALSYSLPNHWYLLAGQAPPLVMQSTVAANPLTDTVAQKHTYLNEANGTRTVEDLLNGSGLSWKYYDWALPSYSEATSTDGSVTNYGNTGPGSAYGFWNPMAAKAESYTQFNSHFVDRTQIFSDLQGNSFPNVSYVIPMGTFSDHPPANVTAGESFIANIVDAVEFSKYWNHTAIFLTWDEYGGFYDHQAPPTALPAPTGLSMRVPLLVISPYTPRGTVDHALGYFESTLAFIEYRWGLHKDCLTSRDCNAPDLGSYFDFDMAPRAPVFINPNWLDDTYPYHYETYNASELDTTSWVGQDNPAIDEDTD